MSGRSRGERRVCTAPSPIVATAGYNNLMINPSYGGAAQPAMAGLIGVVSMP
jgi:hypothetical protein